jgi:hypothetical protein
MLNVLNILHTIYEVSDKIEDGQEFHIDKDFGGVNLKVSATCSPTVDSTDTIIIAQTDAGKIGKTVINALLSAMMGQEITEGVAVPLGVGSPITHNYDEYLIVSVSATIK